MTKKLVGIDDAVYGEGHVSWSPDFEKEMKQGMLQAVSAMSKNQALYELKEQLNELMQAFQEKLHSNALLNHDGYEALKKLRQDINNLFSDKNLLDVSLKMTEQK